ncbi:alpha-ribazole phosphatase family protein [Massilia sp. ST3]|uniref:alpha-ribazole phosphatase family protein n=1 Tax=Massilia sp. ST3 TaxID=2824903 RepID=UPI001B834209|nr:alpha-ribazole phosphatase family protein [Massilia sp. ST3]MBQ5950215.1 alpha-ribazole phosphatase family protein [Massilia sp. ST3]
MRLYLVRHPQPEAPPGICYGSTDLPAIESGIAAALDALTLHGLRELPIFSSPLQRCADLARRLSPTPVFDTRLAEMDFGAWEMRSWDDIPRAEVDAWSADLLHYRPGGGESVLDVAERVADFLHALRAAGPEQTLLICHAGTIRLLASLHQGGGLEEAALRAAQAAHRIAYGELIVLKD